MKKNLTNILLLFSLLVGLMQCQPERMYIKDSLAKLEFSLDTVYFDTIFTQVGTTTKLFKIYNPHRQFIKIENIDLAGGDKSVFRMNVDGISGRSFEQFDLAPRDSMYVFVEATLDPNDDPNILRIQDSIVFLANGHTQDIDLVAWGQDVHMLRDSVLDYSTTWIADKPYLIIDGILVDTLQTLTIEEGVKIHMHRDAGIYVKGTLEVNGSLENPVVIQGDRLEREYMDDPGYAGQWFAIYFAPGSQNNVIDYANIFNGTVGLWADSVVSYDQPVITLSNSEINRMSHDGILARGSSVEAWNTVIGDCGNSCVELLYEGSYKFNHCTMANYWPEWQSNRKTPALYIANYFAYQDTATKEIIIEARDITQAEFTNCIIHGSRANEIQVSKAPDGLLDYRFEKILSRLDRELYDYTFDPNFIDVINVERTYFDSVPVIYELDSLSKAIDFGRKDFARERPFDKNGINRLEDGAPDLGAFEYIDD